MLEGNIHGFRENEKKEVSICTGYMSSISIPGQCNEGVTESIYCTEFVKSDWIIDEEDKCTETQYATQSQQQQHGYQEEPQQDSATRENGRWKMQIWST